MAEPTNGESGQFEPIPWHPGNFAVWCQRWADRNDAQPTTVLLRHSADPFVTRIGDAEDVSLQRAAWAYLEAAQRLPAVQRWPAFLPPSWLEALRPQASSSVFGWMPVERPPAAGAAGYQEPFGSFRVGPASGDHLVALFASQRLGNTPQFLGSGFGLRVVLRVRALGGGAFEASTTGLSACLPFGDYRKFAVTGDTWRSEESINAFRSLLTSPKLRADMARAAGFEEAAVSLRGVRVAQFAPDRRQLELRGIGALGTRDKTRGKYERVSYAFTVLRSDSGKAVLLNRTALVADAAKGDAAVFVCDPASQGAAKSLRLRRPTRSETELDGSRIDEKIISVITAPLKVGPLEVLPCPRFVRADLGRAPGVARPIRLPGSGPTVRSDDASAVQGFRHARELMQRLAAYGLPPQDYFRVAKDQIDVFYRSGISPGPGKSGQTVNARVLPEGWPVNFIGPTPKGTRPALQLHLGLANLSHRARDPWQHYGKRSPATPLGIGADARWMWHEFGHVLLMATTGELELRFAHSPGDALAAIVADPESQLEAGAPRWRFATFPWVFLPRRHDRSVLRGWSWSGALHAALAGVPDAKQPRRKGYQSEQILSSSLFRLYRCLGGDTALAADPTQPDREERRRASHYTTYLIMQALHLLGDARVLPARGPEELEFALELADTRFTTSWSATFPPGSAQTYRRIGGCALKAIRWAFEAQGLYAAGANGNAPGAPPTVDVYIASRRPNAEHMPQGDVDFGPGNYLPVSLHWQAGSSDPVPLWQADGNAIRVHNNGKIDVEVGNRGQQPASGVTVSLWWAEWPNNGPNSPAPQWPDPTQWTPCTPAAPAPQNIAPGATATFGPFDHPPPPGRYIVLAQAGCADDRANTDPATGLACSAQATPLVDLVANDNNLGLCVVVP